MAMGFWASISGLMRSVGRALRRTPVRHGDELTPSFFIRPLEDRRVLSAVALPLQSVVNQLAVNAGRQVLVGSAFAVSRQGQNIEVSITGPQQTIDINGFQSSSAVNLTIRGDATDTINFAGPLDLGGGTLDVMAGSINVSGTLRSQGGAVDLNAGPGGTLLVSGTIDVRSPTAGQVGGTVHLLGGHVGLVDHAAVYASGAMGGGTILIGGDEHGANSQIADSQTVYVGAGVQIAADAVTTGNGGKVVVWSDYSTEFDGDISSRGGALTGNGGSAEVSSKMDLAFNGGVNLSAVHGASGALLLDPKIITIDNTGTDNGSFNLVGGVETIATADKPNTMSISAAKIQNLLQTNAVSLSASTSIDVTQAIDASSVLETNALTLAAPTIQFETGASITTGGGDLTLSGNVTLAGTGTITISTAPTGATGGNLHVTGTIDGGQNLILDTGTAGTIALDTDVGSGTAVSSLTATGSQVTLGGNITTSGAGGINLNGAGLMLAASTVTLDSSAGKGTIKLGAVTGNGDNLTLTNGGAATLGGAISGVKSLTANGGGTLQVNAAISASSLSDSESTTFNVTSSPAVTTTGDENYSGAVTLSQAATLSSTTIELTGGVTFGGNSLTLNNTAQATVGGNFTEFDKLTFTGSLALGANTALTGTTYSLPAVTGNNFDLTLANSGLVTLGGAISGVKVLTANGGGTLQVNAAISASSLSDSEGTTLNVTSSPAVSTTGDQSYSGAVTLSQATTLKSTTIELTDGVTFGGNSLTLNNSGQATVGGNFTEFDKLTFSGSLALGADTTLTGTTYSLPAVKGNNYDLTLTNSALETLGGAISGVNALTANGGGTLQVNAAISASSLSDSEDTTLNVTSSPAVTTTGDQSYSGAVTLSHDTGLKATTLELAGVTGGSNSLTLTNSGLATLGGAISGVKALTANGGGTLQVNAAISASSLSDSEGTTFNLTSSPTVTTTGDQSYSGAVTLSQDTTLNSTTIEMTGGVTFDGNKLTLNNTAQATVGGNFTEFDKLTFSGSLALGADTTLTGTTYSLPAVKGNNHNLLLANGALGTLGGAISGVNALTANGGGTLQVNAAISASSLSDSEGTTLNVTSSPAVTTTGDQSYSGAVTLSHDTGLTATTIELAGVTGGSNSLTLTNSGLATLGGAISGVNALTANGGGTLQVNAAISASSLSDSEGTTLNVTSGPAVSTTGDQSYSGAVTLSHDTGLTATTIELAGVTGGSNSLTLTNSGLATLGGAISGVNVLTANGGGTLQVNAAISASSLSDSEGTTLNVTSSPAVTTTGDQSYSGAVTLSQDTALAAITIELTGVTGGSKSLTLTNSGLATLGGAISGVNALTVNGGGTLQVNAAISASSLSDSEGTTLNVTSSPAVSTTGDQSYSGAVTLSQATTLDSTTIELTDGVTFGGNSLTLDNTGQATVGGNFTEFDKLTFSGSLALVADTTLAGTTYSLPAVRGNNHNLVLANSALGTLGGAISGVNALTANGGGTLQVNAAISASSLSDSEGTTLNVTSSPAVTTTGDQSYSGAVTLSQDTALAAMTIELAGVTGGSNSLTLTNSGLATLGGAISGVNVLAANGGGTLQVNAAISASSLSDSEGTTLNVTSSPAVTTTGGQSFSGALTLSQDTTLNSATIAVGPVNGPFNFTVDAGIGAADFQAAVNDRSITVTAGQVTFSQPVTTTGGVTITNSGPLSMPSMNLGGPFLQQGGGGVSVAGTLTTAGQNITLSNPVALTGSLVVDAGIGTIAFLGPVTAGADNLTLIAGDVNLAGNVSGTAALAIEPGLASEGITLGGPGGGPGLNLTTTGIANIQSSFSSITIGRPSGSGAINIVAPLTFTSSLTIGGVGASSPITVNGQLTMLGNATITLASSGLLALNAGIATTGRPITINNAIALGGTVTLDTTNGGSAPSGSNITLLSTVDGTQNLTLNAGGAAVTFDRNVGSAAPLNQLTVQNAGSGVFVGSNSSPVQNVSAVSGIDIGSLSPITGGIVLDGGPNPGDLLTINLTGTGTPGGQVRLNGPVTELSGVVINAGKNSANGVVLTSLATINSGSEATKTLAISSGAGGILVGASVGNITPLATINFDSSGPIQPAFGVVLRTVSNTGVISAVSNVPLRLQLNPSDPALPLIITDTVQTVTGTLGGNPKLFPGDNVEMGANFHLTVKWSDGITVTSPPNIIISAGDTVELIVNQDGSRKQWIVTHGSGQGPIALKLVHTFSVASLKVAGAQISVMVTATTDPSIALTDSRGTAQNNLGQTTGIVLTPVAGTEFEVPPVPPTFSPPPFIAASAPQFIPVTQQADTLQLATRVESRPVQGEKIDEDTRRLTLVKVDPDGQEEDPQPLPEDALQRLNDLFERFKKIGLPNGLYRIYLEETGFPKRQLLEFYKSGETVGDPVREPGQGSNPVDQGHRHRESKDQGDGNQPGRLQPQPAPGAQPREIDVPADPPEMPRVPEPTLRDASASMWRSLGKMAYPLAGAAVIALGRSGKKAVADGKRESPTVPKAFDLAARLRRNYRDGLRGS